MSIAVIPARGGSKRIPRKNLKPFCQKPIIGWSIEAALSAGCFDRVIVSTDDSEIGAVARDYGAETPFTRPAHLSDDYTDTRTVVAHAIGELGIRDDEEVCCLYATAPFVRAVDLVHGREARSSVNARYSFAVTTYPYPVQRALRLRPDGRLSMFDTDEFAKRSQDLEAAWHDAGQFYWALASTWETPSPIFEGAVPVVIPRYRVQDIDTPEDWRLAELMFQALQRSEDDESRISR